MANSGQDKSTSGGRSPGPAEISARAVDLLHRGMHDEARELYLSMAGRMFASVEVLHRMGYLATEFGDTERAEVLLRAALKRDPEHPWVRNTLGILLRRQHRHGEAVEQFRAALRAAPDSHEVWNNLGNALRDVVRNAEALEAFRRALALSPGTGHYWSAFGACLKNVRLDAPVDAALRSDIVRALGHPEVSPTDVAPAARAILAADPRLARLGAAQTPGEIAGLLRDPLLLALLESAVLADVKLESACAHARAVLLSAAVRDELASPPIEGLAALARQCYLTQYAWFEAPEETGMVEALGNALRTSLPRDADWRCRTAVFAAYRSLALLDGLQIPASEGDPAWQALVRQQIIEPDEERRIEPALRTLGVTPDEVSRAVRDLYETHPYPRWERTGCFEHARPAAQVLHELFPGRVPAGFPAGGVNVLVAGCGTGQHPIMTALRFAGCRVVAVDLSRTSLAYAVRKTRELGLTNIEYAQADLLALDGMAEQFDIIESVGVLHHLRDPLAGWRSLLARLAPHGAMRIGLYSERARRAIVHAQAFARADGTDASPQVLRALRHAILEAREDPLLQRVVRNDDFHSLTGCRDLLRHVQEHRYTPLQLAAMLEVLGLEFLGFELPDAGVRLRYAARFPGDPLQTDLACWDRFEVDEPDTFFGMYQFWVRWGRDRKGA